MAQASAPSSTVDVFIIGAGPVGMAAATNLARYGVSFRIVDKSPGPVTYSQAMNVQSRTQEILDAMGIVNGWIANSFPANDWSLYLNQERIGSLQLGGVDSPYPGTRTLPMSKTEQLFIEHLRSVGVAVERPVEAVDFTQDADAATVTLRHADGTQEIVTARYVISAEGSGSMVRKKVGIPMDGERYAGEVFLQADAQVRWSFPTGRAYVFISEGQFHAFMPFDGEGFYRVIVARPDDDPNYWTDPTLEEMQDYVRKTVDPGATLSDPKWLNRYRTRHAISSRFREGRAFLCGDAGHVHVPIAGQGMNTGIQDAFNLTWKLASVVQGIAPPELLDTYNAERHPVAEGLVKGTDAGFKAMVSPSARTQWELETLGPTVLSLPAVTHRLRDIVAETLIAYDANALVEDHGGSSGPAAGHRAPDARLVDMRDSKTRPVFDLLRGTAWTLLLFTGKKPKPDTLSRLDAIGAEVSRRYQGKVNTFLVATDTETPTRADGVYNIAMDREHETHDKYGVKASCLYLIRPDWYVGFRGHIGYGDKLLAYLGRTLTT